MNESNDVMEIKANIMQKLQVAEVGSITDNDELNTYNIYKEKEKSDNLTPWKHIIGAVHSWGSQHNWCT